MPISFFWFRRDLRLADNIALLQAHKAGDPVQAVFIFDLNILEELPKDDARVTFIYTQLQKIDKDLRDNGSSLLVKKGKPEDIWKELLEEHEAVAIYLNEDYEPYAEERDRTIRQLCESKDVRFESFKDQVIFEPGEVLKDDGDPYTVYTPYKNKWLEHFESSGWDDYDQDVDPVWHQSTYNFPSLDAIGFKQSSIEVPDFDLSVADDYGKTRDFPARDGTSHLGPHLRFGTISVRDVIRELSSKNEVFLSELVWREFFMQILAHFPKVVDHNFRSKYDGINWRNDKDDFKRWCKGRTGYPMVDAGMRQLNVTGYMHNRVRMIVASFLCKHLLIHWSWGESYFAEKLLDYELASNNGNWQWAAGTGCDAAPYFRIFNPHSQLKKFDKDLKYIRKWVPEYDSMEYPEPMVEHKAARQRALDAYKAGIDNA